MVLLVDKGHASVVMDTVTYHIKMSTLIEHGQYQRTVPAPDRPTRKLPKELLTLKRQAGIYQRPFTTKSDLDTNSRVESMVYRKFTRPLRP